MKTCREKIDSVTKKNICILTVEQKIEQVRWLKNVLWLFWGVISQHSEPLLKKK